MCGIAGFIGQPKEDQWQETYRLMEALLLAAEIRGKDATGFVALTEPFKQPHRQRLIKDKLPLRAKDFIVESSAWNSLKHRRCSMILGHTRLATHGSSDSPENLHPFSSHDGKIHLVHNGIIYNHNDLVDRHDLDLLGECDSEALLRILERHHDIAIGLRFCLREVKGSLAVAVYDHRQGIIWLCRNEENPLWLLRLRNEKVWFFASTGEIIISALKEGYGSAYSSKIEVLVPLSSWSIHMLTSDGRLIAQ